MTQVALETLLGLPFVEGLESGHVNRLAALAAEVSFEKNQILFEEDEAHNRFYIILSGQVALEMKTPGRVFRVQTIQERGELGWSSMLAGGRKHFQARALQPVRALAFDGDELQEAFRTDATFGVALLSRVLRIVSGRLEVTRLRLLDVYAPQSARPAP